MTNRTYRVTEIVGTSIKDGAVEHFQVGIKVGFRLEDDE
jgi:flavin-binding protein dodecin